MPKSNNIENRKRKTKKNNRKETFKKYGKNTLRGLRIKEENMKRRKEKPKKKN